MFIEPTSRIFAPSIFSMGGASQAPTGSMANLAEPFSLAFAGINKSVSQFKKYANGRWGSYPGNDWSVGDLAELVARGAIISEVVTPEGATANIPVITGDGNSAPSVPKAGIDLLDYTGDIPEANRPDMGQATAKAESAFVLVAGTAAAVTAAFVIGRYLFKKWG